MFADANLVSRERAVPSRCPLKSAWRDSHGANKETAGSSHEWGLSTMWGPEIEPKCQAWMPLALAAVPFFVGPRVEFSNCRVALEVDGNLPSFLICFL